MNPALAALATRATVAVKNHPDDPRTPALVRKALDAINAAEQVPSFVNVALLRNYNA